MRNDRPARIVLYLVQFPKLSESFIVNKFLGLLAAGYDAHIVCQLSRPEEWSHFPQLTREMRKRVHPLWPRQPESLVLLLLPFALMWGLLRQPKGTVHYLQIGFRQQGLSILKHFYLDLQFILLQPELVHFCFGALAVGQEQLKTRLGCKVTASFRGYDLNYVGLEKPGHYDKVWAMLDACHFLGEDLWQRAQHRGCPADKPHALIPPAIDVEFFKPTIGQKAVIERPLRILSVGRLTWVKGYEYGLQALKQLQAQGISFEYRLIGDGPYRQPLAFWRHELGLEAEVQLTGAQPHAKILEHLQWADIFLHPAVSEGFGNAALEAQLMELPVVCTNAGGLTENVADEESGFVLPRRDPAALAHGLMRLAANPALRQQMGAAGRQRVLRNYSLTDQSAAFDRFFRQVLAEQTKV